MKVNPIQTSLQASVPQNDAQLAKFGLKNRFIAHTHTAIKALQTTSVGGKTPYPKSDGITGMGLLFELYFLLNSCNGKPSAAQAKQIAKLIGEIKTLANSSSIQNQNLKAFLLKALKSFGSKSPPDYANFDLFMNRQTQGGTWLAGWLQTGGFAALKNLNFGDTDLTFSVVMFIFMRIWAVSESSAIDTDFFKQVSPQLLARFLCDYYVQKDTKNGVTNWKEVYASLQQLKGTFNSTFFSHSSSYDSQMKAFFGKNGAFATAINQLFPKGAGSGAYPSNWPAPKYLIGDFEHALDGFISWWGHHNQ